VAIVDYKGCNHNDVARVGKFMIGFPEMLCVIQAGMT